MLDAEELRQLAGRCYRASRACFDLSGAAEFRLLGDELTAKAIEAESVAVAICMKPECENRRSYVSRIS
jgi:hypothetical protein